MGITLLKELASQAKSENVFISPLSIGVALSMAADGANGKTRHAILRTAHQTQGQNLALANSGLIAEVLANADARVGLANAIWLRAEDPPLSTYVRLMNSKYHAEARAVHFGDPAAAYQINRWVKAHTLGLIDHLVERTNPEDFAYLTNALAFQAKWAQPFKKAATEPHAFTNSDRSITHVRMMSQVGDFATARTKNYRLLRMPYGRGGFAAYVLLPDRNDARAIVRTLTKGAFDRALGTIRPQYLRVSIPRFTARFRQSLNGPLVALGMGIAFSGNADFTRMHVPRDIYIQNVEHAAYLRVDEVGTTAAAATSVELSRLGAALAHAPPPAFTVDHPFILAIRDEHTRALLFIGVINDMRDNRI